MKSANFYYKGLMKNSRPVYGKVTLKDDGKVSISIYDSQNLSYGDKLHAKNFANEIVKANFKHEGGITKAWTIIAEGPIQRPHYRYLVK